MPVCQISEPNVYTFLQCMAGCTATKNVSNKFISSQWLPLSVPVNTKIVSLSMCCLAEHGMQSACICP